MATLRSSAALAVLLLLLLPVAWSGTGALLLLPTGQTLSLAPLSSGGSLLLRHCMWHLSVSGCDPSPSGCDGDFNFQVTPALNGHAGAVSFRSLDFPSFYIAPATENTGGVDLLNKSSQLDQDGASFAVSPGMLGANASQYSFQTLSKVPAIAGAYLTATVVCNAGCSFAGGGDVVLAKNPGSNASATWEKHSHTLAPLPPPPPPSPAPPVELKINAASSKRASDRLFGIFFEEINHAGAGGLDAQLVRDRNFNALRRDGFRNGSMHPFARANFVSLRVVGPENVYLTGATGAQLSADRVRLMDNSGGACANGTWPAVSDCDPALAPLHATFKVVRPLQPSRDAERGGNEATLVFSLETGPVASPWNGSYVCADVVAASASPQPSVAVRARNLSDPDFAAECTWERVLATSTTTAVGEAGVPVVVLRNAKTKGFIHVDNDPGGSAGVSTDKLGPGGPATLTASASEATAFEWAAALMNDCPDAMSTGLCSKDMGDAWDVTSEAVSLAIEEQSAPLTPRNTHAMRVTTTRADEGLANYGFFSITIRDGARFVATLYVKPAAAAAADRVSANYPHPATTARLESLDGREIFGTAAMTLQSTNGTWTQLSATISVNLSDSAARNTSARLAFRFHRPGVVLVASAGLLPQANVAVGHIFRLDLLVKLQALRPKFLRFPGGGYIDGCYPDEIWRWKKALGPPEGRPGHWNCWGYYTDDGLGPLEFLQLAELIDAIPVWVLFDGMLACGGAHNACPDQIDHPHMVAARQDVLDALDLCMGNASTAFGRVRQELLGSADVGFDCSTVAIGNEECYNPPHGQFNADAYVAHYAYMHDAIEQRWGAGRVTTINNCDCSPPSATLPNAALTDTVRQACRNHSSSAAMLRKITSKNIFELHSYEGSQTYTTWRHQFDEATYGYSREVDGSPIGKIFISEYATKSGVNDGDLQGALAEAAYMTGMERNSDLVYMACYAPLLVNVHAREWTPDLIAFDSANSFGIPSYWVQKLFSEHSGERILNASLSMDSAVAASAMCKGPSCSTLVLKLVNLMAGPLNLTVSIELPPPPPSFRPASTSAVSGLGWARPGLGVTANVSVLTGELDDQNSFAEPLTVAPRESVLVLELEHLLSHSRRDGSDIGDTGFVLQLPGNSLTVATVEGVARAKSGSS